MRISKRVPITVFMAALAALSTALVVGALSAKGRPLPNPSGPAAPTAPSSS